MHDRAQHAKKSKAGQGLLMPSALIDVYYTNSNLLILTSNAASYYRFTTQLKNNFNNFTLNLLLSLKKVKRIFRCFLHLQKCCKVTKTILRKKEKKIDKINHSNKFHVRFIFNTSQRS